MEEIRVSNCPLRTIIDCEQNIWEIDLHCSMAWLKGTNSNPIFDSYNLNNKQKDIVKKLYGYRWKMLPKEQIETYFKKPIRIKFSFFNLLNLKYLQNCKFEL